MKAYPLSMAQERLWFEYKLDPLGIAYNGRRVLRVSGVLEVSALQTCLDQIVGRHEILRTTYEESGGSTIQRVAEASPLPMALIDLSAASTHNQRELEELAMRVSLSEIQRVFDLNQGPVFRVVLIRISDQEHILTLVAHHIAADGWSLGLFLRELTACYSAAVKREPRRLQDTPMQYGEFALQQLAKVQNGDFAGQIRYWRRQLQGAAPELPLPFDFVRPETPSGKGARTTVLIPAELSELVKNTCRRERVTPFMVLSACFAILLHTLSGETDICLGIDIANRNDGRFEAVMGFFVNQIVLRVDLSGNPSFREFLTRMRHVALEAYQNQDVPFECIVRAIQPRRSLTHSPLFNVKMVFQNTPPVELDTAGLVMRTVPCETGTAAFDLTLTLADAGAGYLGFLEYRTDLFRRRTVEAMARNYVWLATRACADPSLDLSGLYSELAAVNEEPRADEHDRPQHLGHDMFSRARRKAISLQ